MGLFSQRQVARKDEITKETPEKRRFWLFFEIFFGQISKLVIMNFIYAVSMIPLFLGLFICFELDFNSTSILVFRDGGIDIIGLGLIVISLFVSFPATLGFTYVLRNIQRREHAWLWHDFIKHTKLNYLKGVVNGLVTFAFYYIAIFAYGVYRSGLIGGGIMSYYLSLLVLLIMILFAWMQFYVNTMIVTFELKLKDIYKNAFIFALGKLPTNLFVTIVCVIIIYISLLIPLITILVAFSILFSLLGFITVFAVYPTIEANMIDKQPISEDE